jgi:hypothetical protein
MYCVIQKVLNKKPNKYGSYKSLEISSTTLIYEDSKETKYYYTYGGERFERPIRDAYKISIHKSYRENGHVKKKQWVICTVGYYDLIDSFIDEIIVSSFEKKLAQMEVDGEYLWNLIQEKLQPLRNAVKEEFENTVEYKTTKQNEEIIRLYTETKKEFENKYGKDTYDYCFDVFGLLRNEEYLKHLQTVYKTRQQYTRNSGYYSNSYGNYAGSDNSSYYDANYSNYSYEDFSSYFTPKRSTYTEAEKQNLKKMYKVLALQFHPDRAEGNEDVMKLINRVKEEWGI